ncbi:MAG: His/Gly/Thr/Pro-type tRNA ligase C-terminal domain-containing protein, partial [Gammaproteobacteria bacterium]
PDLRLMMHCGGGGFKRQFKKADRSGALLALILGDAELEKKTIGIKPLRQDAAQIEVPWEQLTGTLSQKLEL